MLLDDDSAPLLTVESLSVRLAADISFRDFGFAAGCAAFFVGALPSESSSSLLNSAATLALVVFSVDACLLAISDWALLGALIFTGGFDRDDISDRCLLGDVGERRMMKSALSFCF